MPFQIDLGLVRQPHEEVCWACNYKHHLRFPMKMVERRELLLLMSLMDETIHHLNFDHGFLVAIKWVI